MKQWKVRTHILSLSCTLLVAIICVAGVSLHNQQTSLDRLKSIYDDRIEPIHTLKNIADLYDDCLVDIPIKVRDGVLDGKAAADELEKSIQQIRAFWNAYLETKLTEKEQQLVATLGPQIKEIEAPLTQLRALFDKPDSDAITTFINKQLYIKMEPINQQLDELTDVQLQESKLEYERGKAAHARSQLINTAVILLALIISLIQAVYLVRRLNYQLGAEPSELEALSAQIAQGNLNLGEQSSTSTSGVLGSVEAMRNGLRQIITDINQSSEQIEQTSLQLVNSSGQAVASSQHQRDIAAAMAATTEQLSASITHISQNAQDTHEITQEAGSLTDSGLEVIQQASSEMQHIADLVRQCAYDVETLASQSRNISSIVDVIREIAEQTNLLALNAAIEAARAGEQGRGFAVVADEVRNLAGRTAHSTTEIVALVESIQSGMSKATTSMAAGCERVVKGTQLMEQTSSAMTAIRTALNSSLEAVSVINVSLQEQRQASEQVAMSVEQVAYSAEENSAAQGGIADAIQTLQGMSQRLQGVIGRFSL